MAFCLIATRKIGNPVKKRGQHLLKPLNLRAPLAKFMGVKAAARPQITKAIWAYAKEQQLQQGSTIFNKGALKPLFGKKRVIKFGEIAGMIKAQVQPTKNS
jgi:chromatin remodeling complex protein RSC6